MSVVVLLEWTFTPSDYLSEKEKTFVQLNDEKKQLEIDLGKF